MRKTAKAVEPHQIITHGQGWEKMYEQIRKKTKKKCNGNWEDVAHEAWIISKKQGYFCRQKLAEAARNLGIFRTVYTDKYTILLPPPKSKKACKNKDIETKNKAMDERLVSILKSAVDTRLRAVIRDVLDGEDIVKACKINNIPYRTFIEKCREAAVQPPLFGMGVAE